MQATQSVIEQQEALAFDMARLMSARRNILIDAKAKNRAISEKVAPEREEISYHNTAIEVAIGEILDASTPIERINELRGEIGSSNTALGNLDNVVEQKVGNDLKEVSVMRNTASAVLTYVNRQSGNFEPADNSRVAEVLAELEKARQAKQAAKAAKSKAKKQ